MTVPGAVEHIRRSPRRCPTASCSAPAPSWTPRRRSASPTRAQGSSSARSSGPRSSRRPSAGDSGAARLFLAHRDPQRVGRGRGHHQGVPGDGARPELPERPARPAAPCQALPDGRRLASTTPATGFARAPSRSASGRRWSTRKPSRRATSRAFATTPRASSATSPTRAQVGRVGLRPARTAMPKVVTFGEIMLRLSPPGFERFLQTLAVRRHVRRRRGQRRRQPRAVRARELVRDTAAAARDRRRGGQSASRRRRSDRGHPARRRSHRRLLRRERREPARVGGHLRSRAVGDQRDRSRQRGLGGDFPRRRVVSRHRHHAGARCEGGGRDPRRGRGRACRRGTRQHRLELPPEVMDGGRGAAGDAATRARHRSSSSRTKKTCRRRSGSR